MSEKPLAYVIEDYDDAVIIFKQAMESAGYQVEVSQDGAVARNRLKEITPDIIILDLHLPNVNGETLLKEIRADERFAKTRILLATADALLAERLHGKADMVLLKPISYIQLRQLAERLIGKPRK
jgi:DNA-binding response OmpR family regulator